MASWASFAQPAGLCNARWLARWGRIVPSLMSILALDGHVSAHKSSGPQQALSKQLGRRISIVLYDAKQFRDSISSLPKQVLNFIHRRLARAHSRTAGAPTGLSQGADKQQAASCLRKLPTSDPLAVCDPIVVAVTLSGRLIIEPQPQHQVVDSLTGGESIRRPEL